MRLIYTYIWSEEKQEYLWNTYEMRYEDEQRFAYQYTYNERGHLIRMTGTDVEMGPTDLRWEYTYLE